MTELEKLGYTKKSNEKLGYTEWNNFKEDIRISYDKPTQSFYIRMVSVRRPIALSAKELMALLIDTGYAGITK